MSLKARGELAAAVAPRYQQASKKDKQKILDEFTAATGYHRKYAIDLLHQKAPQISIAKHQHKPWPRRYTAEVKAALVTVWEASNRICSKRLAPFLPTMIDALTRHGHLSLDLEIKSRLLTISPATVDRLLADIRHAGQPHRLSTTKPGFLLKHHIPIRTFADWNEAGPGFVEADLVAHCGNTVLGSYLHTLVMTDIATQWIEFFALLFRGQTAVGQAVEQAQTFFPFPLLGLDTDNGSEFLNYTLWLYCTTHSITFTRSRPYKKNDQCHVEQKNGAVIRRFIGFDRFEGTEPGRILNELYRYLRLYINFYQPSLKLIEKKRQGARVTRQYDQAQTPYQRVLAAPKVSPDSKQKLQKEFLTLDPVYLLQQIHTWQAQLWSYAFLQATASVPPPASETLPPANQLTAPSQVATNSKSGHNSAEPEALTPCSDPVILDQNVSQPTTRQYHRSPRKRRWKPVKRWWRTRTDPFEKVWSEVEQLLKQTPQAQAKTLFEQLRQKYPGKFSDGQLRTFQRRMRTWRTEHVSNQLKDSPKMEIFTPDDNYLR
jgi:hypothetical protein